MRGNPDAGFLGGRAVAIRPGYPTRTGCRRKIKKRGAGASKEMKRKKGGERGEGGEGVYTAEV